MGQLHHDYFYNRFNDLVTIVEGWIADLVPVGDSVIARSVRYGVQSPGKRMRAVLAIAAADLLGIPSETLRRYAVALECLHAGTLVHDDLPALDNDILRRGVPTTHRQFGEGVAVLAGDALFAHAFALLSADEELTETARVELTKVLSKALFDVCDGQVLDIVGGSTERELEVRHLKKTGSLIAASVSGPAKLLSFEERRGEHFLRLQRFGHELGLLFQITDDVLDATQTSEVLGKDAGSDARKNRATYVTLFGVSGARQRAEEHLNNALKAIEPYGERGSFLSSLVYSVSTREK